MVIVAAAYTSVVDTGDHDSSKSYLSFKITKELRVYHFSSSALLSKGIIHAFRPDLLARFYGHLDFILYSTKRVHSQATAIVRYMY